MRRRLIVKVILYTALVFVLWQASSIQAQVQGPWSSPYQLSGVGSKASEAAIIVDDYGFVHAFWTEELSNGENVVLQYARFDGRLWSSPIDIQISSTTFPIKGVSAFLDKQGLIHLVWTQGTTGVIGYTYAPAHNSLSAQKWEASTLLRFPADRAKIIVDQSGVYHILYTRLSGNEPGLYAIRSEDRGITWSLPTWIDPDIPPGQAPGWAQFDIDDAGGLHASWYYISLTEVNGDWIRYAHSLDGGRTWSTPVTLDKEGMEGGSLQLDAARPIMAVAGQTVHIIWAGGELHYRNHSYSTDAGHTWSKPARIFGNLNGQAFEGMTVDSTGRVHFFGQIRFPQGIWHAYWEEDHWSDPELIYLISQSPSDSIGMRIHAHHTYAAVRAGNQIVLTFTDPPPDSERRLFVIHHTLENVPPMIPMPTPTLTITATTTIESDIVPTPVVTPPPPAVDGAEALSTVDIPKPDREIWIGLVPALILIGAVVVTQLWFKSKNR